MTEQTQRAFQKQPTIFIGRTEGGKKKQTLKRFTRAVGLGFKTPPTAKSGKYVDDKCPFTGDVAIRGRILKGIVKSAKMERTITVRRDYLHYIKKYNRFEKRHKNYSAHVSPCFRIKEGDMVTVGECRPLAKTVHFNVVEHTAKGQS
eukprot:341774_1